MDKINAPLSPHALPNRGAASVRLVTEADIHAACILIVDPVDRQAAQLAHLLREAGYSHISTSLQTSEIRALHQEHTYDLILLDLQLPEMENFYALEALRPVRQDGIGLPIIVLTAQSALTLRALQLGARDFIAKPIELLELHTRIRNALEMHLLYKRLQERDEELERQVRARTAELEASAARYRGLAELASDWFWEQDASGAITRATGPVQDMLAPHGSRPVEPDPLDPQDVGGWNAAQHAELLARIAERQPFLDFVLCRTKADGSQQHFQVSGEPVFNHWNKFIGYRGVGLEVDTSRLAEAVAGRPVLSGP